MSRTTPALLALAATVSLALSACGTSTSTDATSEATSSASTEAATAEASAAPTALSVENNLGTAEVSLPVETVVSLDNRTFEVLAAWGVELAAAPVDLIPSTITAYHDESVQNIGTHREPNLEIIAAVEPDLVISGQRFSQYNEDIAALTDAPVIDLEPRDGEALDAELIRQVETLGEVFGKQDEAAALVADFTAALERARAAYDGTSTVMAVNVSGGEIGYIAPGAGRTYGPLFELLGLTPALEIEGGTDSHTGDDISVEAIAESNPDWILVLDRDGAVSADDPAYSPAADVIAANAALQNVTAVTAGHVLVAPADTYTNESIITYTEILTSTAEAFEAAQA